jgi:hypothetical protein
MAKAKNKTSSSVPAPKTPDVPIIVLCASCLRYSQPFNAYADDLSFAAFVTSPGTYYGACSCGCAWTKGTVVRSPDSTEAKLVLVGRDRDRYKKQAEDAAAKIDAYERAMSLMGGGMRMGRTFFGMPY